MLFNHFQQRRLRRSGKSDASLTVPETKVLFLISYFLFAGGVIVVAFSIFFFTIKQVNEALDTFLNCESLGVISGTECDKSEFGAAYYPAQSIFDFGIVIILLYPAVNLIYVIDVQEMKRRLNNLHLAVWSKSTSGTGVQ